MAVVVVVVETNNIFTLEQEKIKWRNAKPCFLKWSSGSEWAQGKISGAASHLTASAWMNGFSLPLLVSQ